VTPDPDDLRPATDEERADMTGPLLDRLGLLLTAYHHGLVVARTQDERELLGEIEALVGPPKSPQT
jgi:hypothetical protein